jgi:hemerythrin-like metal-binding protein
MPEMDGYEATRRIRQFEKDNCMEFPKETPRQQLESPPEGIPIVAMTANVFREDVEKALAAGMNDHIGKPLNFEEVLAKLRKYLPDKVPVVQKSPAKSDGSGIEWGPELSTGNKEIDSHHKQLFRLLNSLAAACVSGQDSASLKESLDFLFSYNKKHMENEEALQLSYQYPGYEEHKKLHEKFKETAANLIAEYKDSVSPMELLDKIQSGFIRDLVQHIKEDDSKMAAYIRGKNGAGISG